MNITGIDNRYPQRAAVKNTVSQSFGTDFAMKVTAGGTTNNPLEYYRNLVKEFPEVTFRLGDRENGFLPGHPNVGIGYNNSMNQIGENFGELGQCSIEIDVAVIRKMQSDPDYELRIKSLIRDSINNYPVYESWAKQEDYGYTSVDIEEEDGEPVRGVCLSSMVYSTEEEVRQIWADNEKQGRADDSLKKKIYIRCMGVKNSLIDDYMKLTGGREEKMGRLGIHEN